MPAATHPAQVRWRVLLLAALTAVLGLLLPATPASAATLPAAETRVGASTLAAPDVVGIHQCITAGQRPVRGPSQLQIAVGNCVTAEAGGGSAASTFHRLESPTQTASNAADQVASKQVWGRAPHYSDRPQVQAYDGPLPEGARGIEFTIDVPPDAYGVPGKPTWSGPRPGVDVDGDFAKLCVLTIWTNQC